MDEDTAKTGLAGNKASASGGSFPPLPEGSIADTLRRNARKFPDRDAVLIPQDDEIRTVTHAQLLDRAENVASWLTARCNKGDRVAVWSNNAFETVILQHACALAGTIIVHLNTGWTDTEVSHALGMVSPSIAFAGKGRGGSDFGARLSALADCDVLPLSEITEIAATPGDGKLPGIAADDPFLIQFTSGTTGKAKGALLSQKAALFGGWVRPACQGGDEHDLWLNSVPYHHIGGSVAIVLGSLAIASAFTVLERYDRDQLIALMRRLKPTRMGGVPTMWHDILASPELPEERSVKIITLGGASVPPSLIRAAAEQLGADCTIGYGQSESGAITTTALNDPIDIVCETVGRASPHMEVEIIDPATGKTQPCGEIGEICARGPGNMIGYWNDPKATGETIRSDGFLRTGDLGSKDRDGVIRIVGRLREVIIRGGENIYPAEVEEALLGHPSVAMAAVVGVDDARLGQAVGAAIKLKPGERGDAAALEDHAAALVAHFKVPRHWRFIEAMPLTASGKVRKTELQEIFR